MFDERESNNMVRVARYTRITLFIFILFSTSTTS